MANLIPQIDNYITNNLNVMLIGTHGVGKSYALRDAAAKHGLTMKYYSCATLDPFTDLVGVPYPDENGTSLKMVRPREIDQAEIIFFDELNRAQDSKTLNAILEIVQFRSINGEHLPRLRSVWAAVNPAGEDYQVIDLDPALVDRFDIFYEVKPDVSVEYLISVGVDKKIAMEISGWWHDRNDDQSDYISPRRMETIGRIVTSTQSVDMIRNMMPPEKKYNVKDLVSRLKKALGQNTNKGPSVLPQVTAPQSGTIKGDKTWLLANQQDTIDRIGRNELSDADFDIILVALSQNIGADKLVQQFAPLLAALPRPKVESMVNGFNQAKKRFFKEEAKGTALDWIV